MPWERILVCPQPQAELYSNGRDCQTVNLVTCSCFWTKHSKESRGDGTMAWCGVTRPYILVHRSTPCFCLEKEGCTLLKKAGRWSGRGCTAGSWSIPLWVVPVEGCQRCRHIITPGGPLWQRFSKWSPEPAASASPGNVLQMQIPGPQPRSLNQESEFEADTQYLNKPDIANKNTNHAVKFEF